MTRLQYDTVVKDLLGVTTLASAGNMPPSSPSSAEDPTGPLTDISWNGYLTAAEKIATQVMAQRHQQGQVHHLRTRPGDLSHRHDQGLRPQGVPPSADRR